MSKLVAFHGDAVESEIHLSRGPVRIGRDSHNDLVLNDKSVTRFHAEVRPEGGNYVIVDLKSRNGVWLNGTQIKSKTTLTLGVPVTIGVYELTLEDDLPTSQFGVPVANQQTVVTPSAVRTSDRPSGSSTRRWSVSSPADDAKRTALLWSGLTLGTVALCVITYGVVKYRSRSQSVALIATSAMPAPPPVTTTIPAPEDLNKPVIEQHLADARVALENREYDVALNDHLAPVLELQPDNEDALTLKQQVENAKAAAVPAPVPVRPPVVKSEPPPEPETPGIPRRQGEASADYNARVTRVKTNFLEGNRALEKKDYGDALAKFDAVQRDQRGYQGVDSLIADATAQRRRAVDEAVDSGQKNEAAGRVLDAVRWYQAALRYDPTAASARDRIAALTDRLTKDGLDAFGKAEVFRKRNDYAKAIESYKLAVEMLPGDHEKSREAQQWLEKLKP
jgi:pSer/pThr/pTyr-binding forkhead associated (FHA) protein/tetratricopeptide (TPR) repeat protein